jgi:hypothetical protein
MEKGIEKGRAVEARAMLLRQGARKLGSPAAARIVARINAITDIEQLENLIDRLLDGSAKTWTQLLE